MEQLLDMGFSRQDVEEALAATGGGSPVDTADWILNNRPSGSASAASNRSPASQQQAKLSHFYPDTQGQTKRPSDPTVAGDHPCPKLPKLRPPPSQPLSERMRPRILADVLGQDHLLAPTSTIRSSLDLSRLPSVILWGPPGSGKTSIARAIAVSAAGSYRFVSLSTVTAGVKDVRDVVEEARKLRMKAAPPSRTILFVDEVHRFNRSQQDSFLPAIEDGTIVFIGATTENPSFHLVTPLLSRCRVLKLNPLQPGDIVRLLRRAADDRERGLVRSVEPASPALVVHDEIYDFLSLHCDGDARVALNALEIAAITAVARLSEGAEGTPFREADAENAPSITATVSLDDAKEALQCKHLAYDRAGEEHYNLISALHKSMRGSDADAAIYWLARMLEGGENPLYIARRLIRFASEDVGLADPAALGCAVACYQACHFLGMPECDVNLAQCVAYLAFAPKSVAVYRAIDAAQTLVRESGGGNEGVPLHLRNAPTKLMKDMGYGKGYIYTPNDPCSPQAFMPRSLQGYKFLCWPPPGPNPKTP